MMQERKSVQKPRLWILAVTLLLSIFYFVFVWRQVDSRMYFTAQEPIFFKDYFFSQFSHLPGGISDYLGLFFSQFYFYQVTGALVPVLGVIFVTLSTLLVISRFQKTPFLLFTFLPAIVLMYLYSYYTFPFSVIIGLSASCLAFWSFSLIKAKWLRILGFAILTWLINYIAAGASHICVLLAALYEIFKYRRVWVGALFLVLGAAIPWLNTQIFLANPQQVYIFPFAHQDELGNKPFLLLAIVPLAVLLNSTMQRLQFRLQNRPALAAQVLVVLGVFIGGSFFTFRSNMNDFNKVEYLARNRQWHELLQCCSSRYPNHPQSIFHINRALCHTGTLLDRMFYYSQNFGKSALVFHPNQKLTTPLVRSDLYFDAGNFNEAKHWTYEAVSVQGLTLWNLQRLVLIHLLYRETELAEKYLNRLNSTRIGRSWAKRYRPYLQPDADIARDPVLAAMQQRQIQHEYLTFIYLPEQEFTNILKENPNNRFAFEFLSAYYLLEKDINKLVDLWENAPESIKNNMPRYYEEAFLYLSLRDPQIHTGEFEPNVINRFKEFIKVMRNHQKSVRARQLLSQTHRDTFWYYLTFINPVGA